MPKTAPETPTDSTFDENEKENVKKGSNPYELTPENRKRVSSRITKHMQKSRFQRYQFEREWFQSVLYYSGNQWIVWDRDKKQWKKKGGPDWWPKPVTNVLAAKVDDNVSSLTQETPQVAWIPTTDDIADIATAEVADRVDETIAEEVGREKNARRKATWAVLTGSAFVESYYDTSEEHGMSFVQHEECKDCEHIAGPKDFRVEEGKQCPNCGSLNTKPAFQMIGSECDVCEYQDGPEMRRQPCPSCEQRVMLESVEQANSGFEESGMGDPMAEMTGEQTAPAGTMQPVYNQEKIGEEVPRGKICEKVRSPFEIFFDHSSVESFTTDGGLKACCVVEMEDADSIKEKYKLPLDMPGSAPGSESSLSTLYRESLSVLSNMQDGQFGYYNSSIKGTGHGSNADKFLREAYYELPCEKFPKGLFAVRINGEGGEVVEFGPLPYTDTDDKPFIPIVHIKFKDQPGRVWGKSFVTDIIPLQDARNQTEAMMMLCERRMGNPVWLMPTGIVDRDPSGEPGEVIWYQPFGGGNGGRQPMPDRLDGVNPPTYFVQRMEDLDRQIERISGSFGIASGEAPPGVTAASALQLLAERQSRSVSPQITAWELAHEQVSWQQMMIFRMYAVDERIRARKGDNSRWQVEKFSTTDLTGNFSVAVEVGSATPKSMATRRAQMEGLINMQILNPGDPEQQYKILQRFGEAEMFSHIQVDVLDAQKENEKFMRYAQGQPGGEAPRIRELFDNHEAHIKEHLVLGKSDDYRHLEKRAIEGDEHAEQALIEYEAHVQEHMKIVQEAQMEAQRAAAMAENPEGMMDGPGAGRPEGTGNTFDRGQRAPGEEAQRKPAVPPGGGVKGIDEPQPKMGL